MSTPAPLQLPPTVQQHLYTDSAQCAQALAATVAQALREGLREGLRQRGAASLVVSGGRTPIPFFEALSAIDLDWSQVTVSLADDRWVAADHADSNEHLVRQHLLHGPAAAARFVPLVDVAQTPEQHLPAAEQALAQVPHPHDALILGMGDDGHTASLFPGAPGTAEAMDVRRPPLVAAVTPATAPHRRITLTLRALLQTRLLLIHLAGEDKRATIEQAARGTPAQYPIAAVLQQQAVPVALYYSP